MKSTTLQNLDERIVAAFNSDIAADDLRSLIKEVSRAADHAEHVARNAEAHALDPRLPAAKVGQARDHARDAAFTRDRLKTALPKPPSVDFCLITDFVPGGSEHRAIKPRLQRNTSLVTLSKRLVCKECGGKSVQRP